MKQKIVKIGRFIEVIITNNDHIFVGMLVLMAVVIMGGGSLISSMIS